MKKATLLLLILISVLSSNGQVADSLFAELDKCLANSNQYISQKKDSITAIHEQLNQAQSVDQKWELYNRLVNQYEVFIYDSAFKYANLLHATSFKLNQKEKIAASRARLVFILSSRGLFKEANDTLQVINVELLPNNEKVTFYKTLVKYYMDLQHYAGEGYYSAIYDKKISDACDSVIVHSPPNSTSDLMYKAVKEVNMDNPANAIKYYNEILEHNQPSFHEQAMVHATLGFIFSSVGNQQASKRHLLKASIADIKGNIKETTALRGLAELLFNQGEIEKAYRYILAAKYDAEFYGTRHRIVQISAIFPQIEQAYLQKVEQKQRRMVKSIVLFTGLLLISLLLTLITFLQLKKLRKARKTIIKSNQSLRLLNQQLKESNLINQKYIGFYFNKSSQLIDKIEDLSRGIIRSLNSNQINNIKLNLNKVDPKKERKDLFETFDKTFLSIFPKYVDLYNQLFTEQEQQDNAQELTTPQRIYALIKIGITDNEEIAKILGFSVNTIYTYKTKEKKRSKLTGEAFEAHIKNIKST